MTEITLPLIVKAFSRVSSSSEGPIVLQVETESGEPVTLKLSLVAAIQVCALLLGDSRIGQAIDLKGKTIFPKNSDATTQARHCSFCGRAHIEVNKLVVGPDIAICSECIVVCIGALSEGNAPKNSI